MTTYIFALYVAIVMYYDGTAHKESTARPSGDRLSSRSERQKSIRYHEVTRMKKLLRKDTILGIGANCVLDPSLDTRRDAMSAYDNAGAKELAEAIGEKGLVDITRQSLL